MNRREFLKKGLEGIVVGSIPLISKCSKNPVESNLQENSMQKIDKAIIFDLKLDKFDYELGETVIIVYSLYNLNYFDITIWFPNQQQFKYNILKEGSNVFSYPQGWYPAISKRVLRKKEVLEFNRNWNQENDYGDPVQSGKYTIISELYGGRLENFSGEKIDSDLSLEFSILPK